MTTGAVPRTRLVTLDVLRGITVAMMILVNNSGETTHTWPILEHAPWNGFTLADFVFPAFLFMVGMSIELSMKARRSKGASARSLLVPVARRAAIIFALGLMLSGFPFYHLHTFRVYGVLQRIALCFLVSSVMVLYCRTRGIVMACVGLLAGYWILLRFVPAPGLGWPVRDVPLLDPFANVVSWTDRALFSSSHLYRHGVYDPCGLLGTLPAIVSTLMGVVAGKWMLGNDRGR